MAEGDLPVVLAQVVVINPVEGVLAHNGIDLKEEVLVHNDMEDTQEVVMTTTREVVMTTTMVT